MSIIVVLENPGNTALLVVHAAAADPDVAEDPGPVTACGIDTAPMVAEHWRPAGPGARWYPPRLRQWVCPLCDRAVRMS
ncbi:hypothetical protein ABZX88_35425 [Kitasatospora aureofaciens]|uniref:hypothetical protein n=1 Tax=Kitasatospora aureofaciens TaxID=1894 RepID=UPI0033A1C4D3